MAYNANLTIKTSIDNFLALNTLTSSSTGSNLAYQPFNFPRHSPIKLDSVNIHRLFFIINITFIFNLMELIDFYVCKWRQPLTEGG